MIKAVCAEKAPKLLFSRLELIVSLFLGSACPQLIQEHGQVRMVSVGLGERVWVQSRES